MTKCILSLMVLFMASSTFAADAEDEIAMIREMAATERLALVTANMELTEVEEKAFWPLYRLYRAEVTKLDDRALAMIEDYAQHSQGMSNEKARQITEEWFEIEQERLSVKQRHARKFRSALSEIKVARLLQIENKIDAVKRLDVASQIPLMQ